MKLIALILSSALVLSACSSKDDGTKGTDMTLNATGDKGESVKASADGNTGKVAVNLPGFKAEIDMPKIHLDAEDFEMNGAKLYPGSKIDKVNVEAMKAKGGNDNGVVNVTFTAPADLATVKAWFTKEMTETADFKLTPNAAGLSGTNDKGDAFTLNLSAPDAQHTTGVLQMSGR
jgi:hypothetical protein